MDKIAEIILDPFQINLNNRKILSKVYQDIMYEVREKCPEKIMKMRTLLEQFMIEICDMSEFVLTYDMNPDYLDLLKMYNVHVDIEDSDLASRIISYVKLSHRVLNTSLFIFVNLKSFFLNNALDNLLRTLLYEKVNVLLIERCDLDKSKYEKRIIIDKDSCVILEE